MKFNTKVKYNGKYYAAGEDVHMNEPKAEEPEAPADKPKAKPVKVKK